MKRMEPSFSRAMAACLLVAALGSTLSACAPVVVGAAVGTGVLVATDRRTTGIQVEDEAIELKAGSRISDALGSRVRVNVTSFNRQVLLTGEVGSETDRQRVQQIVSGVENVRSVVNELAVLNSPSLTQRSSDALVTAKVKAGFVDAKELSANAFKVVTERGTTYLMGRVTQREADRATEIARTTGGVQRVVRIFELITEQELRQLQLAPSSDATPTRVN
jgi:osmotically-inducible protein OsmY